MITLAATHVQAGRSLSRIWRARRRIATVRIRTALAALCLFGVPMVAGTYVHNATVSEWELYTVDGGAMNAVFDHREAALVLNERASRLQPVRGEDIRYRWTEKSGGEAVGYVETGQGYLPLATQSYGTYLGRELTAGVVENDLGAIVTHISGLTKGGCNNMSRWMGDYTKTRATAAILTEPLPRYEATETLRHARWESLADAVERCGAGEYGPTLTLLMRFDGFVSAEAKPSP